MKTGAILTLRGRHPYYPNECEDLTIELPLHGAVPGNVVSDRNTATVEQRHDDDSWTILAGPYATTASRRAGREQATADRRALLGLVWDLQGSPIHPSLGRRRAYDFVAVMDEDGGVEIWRRTRELLCEREAKIDRIRAVGGEPRAVRKESHAA